MNVQSLLHRPSLILGLLALISLYCAVVLGYGVEQSDFYRIITHYGIWFLCFLGTYWIVEKKQLVELLMAGILLRLVMVFALPALSDDLYRFIWDGRLWLNGINPFDHKPVYYIENEMGLPGINLELFEQLNSPEYFTIYPPVAQLIFVVACWLSPSSIWGSSIIMKLFLLAAEVGNVVLIRKLLAHFKLPPKRILLYALNPLIIVEVVGNLHFEGLMIFFLLLGYWFWIQNSWWKGATAVSLSVATKLLPLMFLPFLIRRLGWKKSIYSFLLMGFILIAAFLPLFSADFVRNFSSSLDLYFRRFEFNASIYYLARWVGYQVEGYNLIARIGPRLALVTLLSICAFALLERKKDWKSWPSRALFAMTIYLLMTVTVHPWYLSLPIVLCIFTRFRYPILWSGLIFLTYINYSYPTYQENLWLVSVEYLLVLSLVIWELRQGKSSKSRPAF